FTNLDPGNYTLEIKGSNNAKVWNEDIKQLDIYISPPWYETNLAKAGFVLFIILTTIGIYNFQLRRKLATQETERLQELDRLKTKFFTDIAHEFRTPLTVILGMVSTIKGNLKARELIQRNGNNMLNLVNQMLDLRKLEAGKLPLNIVQTDIIDYLKYVFESFDSYAQENDIKLHFLPNTKRLVMDYDPDKILRIVSNLVSNAIKYNKPGGHVYLQITEESVNQKPYVSVRVKDTGIGIQPEALEKIFERFYQTKEQQERSTKPGTGIGLSLTRELVRLFKGDINVKSIPDRETEFQFRLPITNNGPLSDESMAVQQQLEKGAASNYLRQPALSEYILSAEEKAIQNGQSKETKLLIIEDNIDVVEYLRTCLESIYDLNIAYDGEEGIRLALEDIPDIIISDVMMPKKDGFEVLETLKADERTSHIPFVMLTAKSDLESRIQGLKTGAEVYLA
ncbi:MAG: ATP-binding protein, partial [Bacteroidota bacterium]